MKPAYEDNWTKIYAVDALNGAALLKPNGVHAIITSPPYFGLRSYLPEGHPDKTKEIGAESRPEAWVDNLAEVFGALRPVLYDSGTLWVVVGDAYADRRFTALKPKDLIGLPFMLAFALRADGWYWRSCSIWDKPNKMPENVTDRPTVSHEYVLMFSKKPRYFFDQDAVMEKALQPEGVSALTGQHKALDLRGNRALNKSKLGTNQGTSLRNIRSVWNIPTRPYPGSHYATFPPDLLYPCIKAGTSERGVCEVCGAPWERVVEQEPVAKDRSTGRNWLGAIKAQDNWSSGTPTHSGLGNDTVPSSRTIGWQPTCSCDVDAEPATVLDPFIGSGTTAWAARRLGRKSVGFDLDERNVELIQERLGPQGVLL